MSNIKQVPHNIDAEENVIGSLLIGGEKATEIGLSPADFYSERNQVLFGACYALAEREVSTNQITVAQELATQKKLELVGGAAYLSHLIAVCATPLDLRYYADIVKRLSLYRQLIKAGGNITQIGYDAPTDVNRSLSTADDMLLEVRKQGAPSPIVTPDDRVTKLAERYTKLYSIEAGAATKSSLRDLDWQLGGGLYDGDMIILASRPGLGKTTFAQTIANNVGMTKKVLFCSVEMSVEGISDRDVAGLVGKPINVIRLGGYTPELYCDITGMALEYMRGLGVYYFKDYPMTTDKIRQAGIAMQLRYGLDLIVVDYLGLLDDEYGRSPYDRISYMSRKVKHIALSLNVPVLALHQLNRAVEEREDKRPQLFDLRESGRLEEDSDVVLFLYRDSYYKRYGEDEAQPSDNSGVTEVIIAKQRQGQSNRIIKVWYDEKHQKYFDYTERG